MPEMTKTPVQPVLYIGIGGSGKEVLLALRRRFFESFNLRARDLPPFVRFLLIDTDTTTKGMLKGTAGFMSEAIDLDRYTETHFVPLTADLIAPLEGSFDQHPQINSWLDEKLFERAKCAPGAGAQQKRQLGRLATFLHYNTLRPKLTDRLATKAAAATDEKIAGLDWFEKADKKLRVYVIGSLSGGTGSGTFLDIAYMVRNLVPGEENLDGIHGIFLLPDVYTRCDPKLEQQANKDQFIAVQANGYAALQELEHFSRVGMSATPAFLETDEDSGDAPSWMRGVFPRAWGEEEVKRGGTLAKPPYDKVMLVSSTNEAGQTVSDRRDVIEMVADRLFVVYETQDVQSVMNSLDSNNVGALLESYLIGPSLFTRRFCTFGVSKYWLGTSVIRNGLCLRLAQMAVQDFVSGTLDPSPDAGALSPQQVADRARELLRLMQVDPKDQLILKTVAPKFQEALAKEFQAAGNSPDGHRRILAYLRQGNPEGGFLGSVYKALLDQIRDALKPRFFLPAQVPNVDEPLRQSLAQRYWDNAYLGCDKDAKARDEAIGQKGAPPSAEEVVLYLLDRFGADDAARILRQMSQVLSGEASRCAEAFGKAAQSRGGLSDRTIERWSDALAISWNILGTREEAVGVESGRAGKAVQAEAIEWVRAIASQLVNEVLNPAQGISPKPAGVVSKMVEYVSKARTACENLLKGKDGLDEALVSFFKTGHASERYKSPILDDLRTKGDQFIRDTATLYLYFGLFGKEGQTPQNLRIEEFQEQMQLLVMYLRQFWFRRMYERRPSQRMFLDLAIPDKCLGRDEMIEALHRVCFELPFMDPKELQKNLRKAEAFHGLKDIFKKRSAAEFLIAKDPTDDLKRRLLEMAKPYALLEPGLPEVKSKCGGTAYLVMKEPAEGKDKLKTLTEPFENPQGTFQSDILPSRSDDAITVVYERTAIPLPALKPVQELQKWYEMGMEGGGLYLFEDRAGARYSAILPEITPPLGKKAEQRRAQLANSILGIVTGVVEWNDRIGVFKIGVRTTKGVEEVPLGQGLIDVVRAVCGMARLSVPGGAINESLQNAVWERLKEMPDERRLVVLALLAYCQRYYCVKGKDSDAARDHNLLWYDVLEEEIGRQRDALVCKASGAAVDEKLTRIVYPWLDGLFRFVGARGNERTREGFRMLPTVDPRLDPNTMRTNRAIHREQLASRVDGRNPTDVVKKYSNLHPLVPGDDVLGSVMDLWQKALEDPSVIPAEVKEFAQRAVQRA